MRLTIYGVPAPQGSKSAFVRGGRPILVEGGSKTGRQKHAAWRQAVATAARDHLTGGGEIVADGPVHVACYFVMPKPKSRRKAERWVTVKPDLDKLVRAVLDGLADGGVLDADQRVSSLAAEKRYAEPGEPSGCVVLVDGLESEPIRIPLRGVAPS